MLLTRIKRLRDKRRRRVKHFDAAKRFEDSIREKREALRKKRRTLRRARLRRLRTRLRARLRRLRTLLRARLRRLKQASKRAVVKHPVLSIFCLGLLVSVLLWVLLAVTLPNFENSGKVTMISSAPPPAMPTVDTAMAVESAGVTNKLNNEPDVAKSLLRRIVEGDYARRTDVATGRFLRDFENQLDLLLDTDWKELTRTLGGRKSVQVSAPYHFSETRWAHRSHLIERSLRWKRGKKTEALIRLVKNETWRIEHIQVR